ncbi:MAG TPA: diguanylate cyclase, partial [Solirubrobacteraceae bacterium]|nr:diguanylate cyclase [Solirubrobacteraceae bacterium]
MASNLTLPAARVDDTVLRAALDAIISIDAYGLVVEFNPAAERMFGRLRDDVIGADMADLIIPPGQREAHRRGLQRLLDGGAERMFEQRIELEAQRAGGSTLPVELAITRLAGSGASAIYTGFIRDLTDSKRAERERHERIARQALVVALGQTALGGLGPPELVAHALATIVEGLAVERGVALAVTPDGGMRREAAIGLGSLAGHGEPAGEAQAQLLHRTVAANGSLLLRGAELADLADTGMLFVQGMRAVLCVTLQGDRGSVNGLLAIAAADADALGSADIGFAQAIANVVGTAVARWRADQEITRLGLHDPLTGLANRPLFENRLEQALERSRRGEAEAGLLFVDLDGFSKLNDGFGHRTGDEVLVGAGARLRGALPAGATAGRLAGDDFGVLVPDVEAHSELLDLANRIGIALREPMLAGGRELTTTASIGVVMTDRGLGNAGELLRTASAAAVRARERGGGRAELATQGMRRRLVHAAEIEQGLRRALTDGELRLHYQPIVDL